MILFFHDGKCQGAKVWKNDWNLWHLSLLKSSVLKLGSHYKLHYSLLRHFVLWSTLMFICRWETFFKLLLASIDYQLHGGVSTRAGCEWCILLFSYLSGPITEPHESVWSCFSSARLPGEEIFSMNVLNWRQPCCQVGFSSAFPPVSL